MSFVLSCVQPTYLSWIPLFKRMVEGDIFVYLDDVEYSKNSFHNRNYIKGPQGKILLTVPVKYKGFSHKYISQIEIHDKINWQKKHWRTIEMNYNKAPYYYELKENIFSQIYDRNWEILGDLNIAFIELIKNYLNINCDTYLSSELGIKSSGNQKLIDICKLLNVDRFLVKPNTENYHPKAYFEQNGIKLIEFAPLSIPYLQQYGCFSSDISALDYAMNCGAGEFKW